DFAAVMARMRRLRAGISRHDSAARFRGLGVDVFLGEARFTGPDAVAVGGQTLRFARAVIATGTRPAALEVPGLGPGDYLTNETVFDLDELPRRVEKAGQTARLPADALLVAVGRRPNVEGLGLEQAGVEYDARAVKVNDYLQTANRNVYAAGDVCSPYKFTHAADAMARIVL